MGRNSHKWKCPFRLESFFHHDLNVGFIFSQYKNYYGRIEYQTFPRNFFFLLGIGHTRFEKRLEKLCWNVLNNRLNRKTNILDNGIVYFLCINFIL